MVSAALTTPLQQSRQPVNSPVTKRAFFMRISFELASDRTGGRNEVLHGARTDRHPGIFGKKAIDD